MVNEISLDTILDKCTKNESSELFTKYNKGNRIYYVVNPERSPEKILPEIGEDIRCKYAEGNYECCVIVPMGREKDFLAETKLLPSGIYYIITVKPYNYNNIHPTSRCDEVSDNFCYPTHP